MTAELFRAITLSPGRWEFDRPVVERPRLTNLIRQQSNLRTFAWVVGPIGSGKTTVALQWAKGLEDDIQFLSASPPEFSSDNKPLPPDEFGIALEDLFNATANELHNPSTEELSILLDRVIALSLEKRRSFILDDLEKVRRSSMMTLQGLLIEALPKLRTEQAMIISRTIDSEIVSNMQALRSLKLVLPSTLEFTREETAVAHQSGIFGTASLDQVEAARSSSSGWITGMLATLHGHGGETIDPSHMRSLVLNDLLLHQPPPVLSVMVASAILPYNHRSIWEQWFDHLGLPRLLIPATGTQIPTQIIANEQDQFRLSPVIREHLSDLSRLVVPQKDLRELLAIALRWFAHNGDIEAANALSVSHDLKNELLQELRPICSDLMEDENWSEIRAILDNVDDNTILSDDELTFWYFLSLVDTNKWARMKQLQDRFLSLSRVSRKPLDAGRIHLFKAWGEYMLNHGDQALEHSTLAYNLVPENHHRERLWAAGTAAISEALRGDEKEARRWSALSAYEQTFISGRSTWWHNNAGPIQLSWLAIKGMPREAQTFLISQIRNLGDHSPDSVRYLLLLAQIEIERLNFDSASNFLAQARDLITDRFSLDHHSRIVHSNFHRAKGEFDTALEFLSTTSSPGIQRFDQITRELFNRARLALDMGDVDGAELYLNSAPQWDSAWPKNYGDAHPGLVATKIHYMNGRSDEAIAVAKAVLNEATRRTHTYYVVTANVALTYIYHMLNQEHLRDQSLEAANRAAGKSGFELAYMFASHDVRELVTESIETTTDAARATAPTHGSSIDRLTSRELQVLSLVAQSYTNKEIADQMYISVSTVKNHLASAYDKLGTNNRRGAVTMARNLGLIQT